LVRLLRNRPGITFPFVEWRAWVGHGWGMGGPEPGRFERRCPTAGASKMSPDIRFVR
jgi:hypothetical protein